MNAVLSESVKRPSRQISEREIAVAFVLLLAEVCMDRRFIGETVSLMGYYDQDAEFIDELESRLNVDDKESNPFRAKLARVVRNLVRYGVLYSQMKCTYKEVFGEPTKQMNYGFMKPGKAYLLTRGATEHTGSPEWEAAWLLRRAYPAPEEH